MAFWHRKKAWEDDYDEYYAQDRRTGEKPRDFTRLRFITHSLVLTFAGALFFGAVGTVAGATMMEKMLTDLLMPVGIVWLALIVMIYFCCLTRQAWPALVGLFCWLVLTLSGNTFVSNLLISHLESPYQNFDIEKMEPVDTIVVLGGGTSSRINGGSQLTFAGDRVTTAARLFHEGKVKNMICTGTNSFQASEKDLNPREEAMEILISLNVPSANVMQMKGKNTFEEMKNLSLWVAQNPDQGRIGMLTSAWHLPRTMRLAKSNGLDLVPIPCNFLTQPNGPSPNLVVPSSERIEVTRRAMKEILAGWVGR